MKKEKKLKKMGIEKEEVLKQLKRQIINLIQIGWRGRIIKIGFEDTEREIEKRRKGFLIIAEDIAERTKRNILKIFKGEYFQLFKKSEIGTFLGKGEIGIIFVPETKFGLKLKNLLEQYLELYSRR